MTVVIDPDAAPPSGTTLGDIVNQVQDALGEREQVNLLADAIDEDQTVITFVHPLVGIERSTQLNIDDEVVYVWDTDTSNKTATVQRGWRSAATSHPAQTLVVNGGNSQKNIVQAINDELSRLSSQGLYQMRSVAVNTTVSQASYPLDGLTNVNVYDVQALSIGTASSWMSLKDWRFSNIDSTLVTNSRYQSTRVLYKDNFKSATDLNDDITTVCGLHSEAFDILKWGACAALTTSEEYKRNDFRTQGDTRRPSEVPYRAMALSRRDFIDRRDQRTQEERDRLNKKFPYRKRGW